MSSLSHIIDQAKNYLSSGNERSVKAKKNILGSFFVKGFSMALGIILGRFTVIYLTEEDFGLWTTIYSVVTWFSFFDIGLGNGLRNRFAEALAKDDHVGARIYVSSTYFVLTLISTALLLIFLVSYMFVDWGFVFNAPEKSEVVGQVVLIVFSFFCISFVLKLITPILLSDQRPATNDLIKLLANVISLILIVILIQTTQGSLLYLSIAMSIAPLVIFSLVSLYFFSKDYKAYVPSLKYVKREYFNDLMNLGGKFFLIQIIGVIIFSTDNFIILHVFSAEEVGPYNLTFRYFNLLTMAFSIISVPFWSAYTEAYSKEDFGWIRKTNKKLIQVWLLMALGGVLMLLISPFALPFLWTDKLEFSFMLSALMLVFVLVKAWGGIYVMFINGVGKVKLQMITSIFGGIANIPLSIFFAKNLGLGPVGVIIASTICLFYGPLIGPFHYKKIMNRTAKGIWDK